MRKKSVRITAFFIACVLVGICGFRISSIFKSHPEMLSNTNKYDECHKYTEEVNSLNSQLWALGMIYLRNLDDNGKLQGSKEFVKNTKEELKRLGLMDEDEKITIKDNDFFNYSVSWDKNKYSDTQQDLNTTKYSFTQKNDNIVHPEWIKMIYTGENKAFESNYGATVYIFNGKMPVKRSVIYDFDTTGLPSWYVDDAKYYYRTDGTTLVPDDFVKQMHSNVYHDENGVPYVVWYNENGEKIDEYTEDTTEPQTETTSKKENATIKTTKASIDIYDYKSVYENNSKFKAVEISTYPLSITITPKPELIGILNQIQEEENIRINEINKQIDITIPFGILAFIFAVYFLWAGGYDEKEKRYIVKGFDKAFVELPLSLIFLSTMFLSVSFVYFHETFRNIYNLKCFSVLFATGIAGIFGLALAMVNTVIIRLKCRCLIKTSLIIKILEFIFRKIKNTIRKINLKSQLKADVMSRIFVIRTIVAVILGISVFSMFIDFQGYMQIFICFLIIIILYAYLNLRDLKSYTELNKHIESIRNGDYSKHEVSETSYIYTPTENLNGISEGIQKSVEQQLKAERMKIDLVTNVSHDLKTPLTSIISYIDLLSQEELPAGARDFVNIIQHKSERLKIIVSDLFELAKATSKTDIELEKIDEVILIEQVLADMDDKIKSFGREIRTEISTDSAIINADGKKMYRVLQNIIDNALKYSLDGTRIWITLKKSEDYTVFTIKNTSSYEMNFNSDEITERFVRGDESRTSEGNGLGLSIARGFVEACGGKFDISIDGDVFSAEIKFKLQNKPF